jgi:hypothetical protein
VQEAVYSVACLRSPKVRPNTGMHLGQLRLGMLQQIVCALCWLGFARAFGHLLHLFEAVYHSSCLTVTVVLGRSFYLGLLSETPLFTRRTSKRMAASSISVSLVCTLLLLRQTQLNHLFWGAYRSENNVSYLSVVVLGSTPAVPESVFTGRPLYPGFAGMVALVRRSRTGLEKQLYTAGFSGES